ncbi:MAG TPA: hypothetical protein VMY05_04145 [Acidobacteriota bacterium]|nr:hypothetical protein [Acidobacteriota bacterium]
MNDKTRKRLVSLLFIAAVIWAAFTFPGRSDKPVSYPAPARGVIQASTASGTIRAPLDVQQHRAKPWGNDPFRASPEFSKGSPVVARQPRSPGWRLSGTLYSQGFPLAYLNGRTVSVGDTVNGARVISIEQGTVTLEHRGDRFTIRVSKG